MVDDKTTIIDEIIEIISDELDIEEFDLDDNLVNDLGLDSLGVMVLIMRVEKHFKLRKFNELVIERIKTPQDIINEVVWVM